MYEEMHRSENHQIQDSYLWKGAGKGIQLGLQHLCKFVMFFF